MLRAIEPGLGRSRAAVYRGQCIAGEASIWSLTCEFPDGSRHYGAIIEVDRDGTIVQCRGFANRSLDAE
jgi:hypothetical protein